MKNLFLIITLWFCALSLVSGQAFVQLSNATGYEYTSAEVDSLEVAAISLLESLNDTSISSKFKVFHVGYYLHNSSMAENTELFWDKTKQQVTSLSNYYLLIGREVNELGKSRLRYDIKLPSQIFSINSCFTREYIEIVMSALNSKYSNIEAKDMFLSLKKSITEIGSKIFNNLNCCTTNRNPTPSCSWCKYDMDEVAAQLEQDGYFDFSRILKLLTGWNDYKIEIKDTVYSTINSNFKISYINGIETYNLTDILEAFIKKYEPNGIVNIKYFDDIQSTQNVECYFEDVALRLSGTYYEEVVALNYNKEKRIFIKLNYNKDYCDQIDLFYYNASKHENHPKKMENINDLCTNSNIEAARGRMEEIWDYNNFNGQFKFNKVENTNSKETVILDKINLFMNFISYLSYTHGRVAFFPADGLILDKDISNAGYGCWVNFEPHSNLDPCGPGHTFAHEIAHALTIRGSRYMQPENYLEVPKLAKTHTIEKIDGGHMDWNANLLCRGERPFGSSYKFVQPVEASCGSDFNDYDKLNHESLYLIYKFLASSN